MTFRVQVIVNRVGNAGSVIRFGTVGKTDVGIWVVDDERLGTPLSCGPKVNITELRPEGITNCGRICIQITAASSWWYDSPTTFL